jgi:hypothetical protein
MKKHTCVKSVDPRTFFTSDDDPSRGKGRETDESMRRSFPLVRLWRCSRNLSTLSADQFSAYISRTVPPPSPINSVTSQSLRGRTIALKDNICTNDDLPTSCASTMLNGNPSNTLSNRRILFSLRCDCRVSAERRRGRDHGQNKYG